MEIGLDQNLLINLHKRFNDEVCLSIKENETRLKYLRIYGRT